MPVSFNPDLDAFIIRPDHCPTCGQPLYVSGCTAPGCSGLSCENCGDGCDLDFAPDGEGRCAAALAAESDDDRAARVNAGRAAFGLAPIDGAR